MKNGTLSNEAQGRFLVLWEGVLAKLPDAAAARRFRALDAVGRRRRALAQYQPVPLGRAALTDLAYRRGVPVDLVTYLAEKYVSVLRERVEAEALPVGRILAHTERSLDEYVRHDLLVLGVIHPQPDRPFLFGTKGYPVNAGKGWSVF